MPIPIILITGHPATGKTTLARFLASRLGLPLICKDDIKECLYDTLGWAEDGLQQKLAVATWELLYLQVEKLLAAKIAMIVESDFDPQYANAHWRRLSGQYELRVAQIRCECDPDVLMARYRERIRQGERHPGHADHANSKPFQEIIRAGAMDWIAIPSEKIAVDTTVVKIDQYFHISTQIQQQFLSLDAKSR